MRRSSSGCSGAGLACPAPSVGAFVLSIASSSSVRRLIRREDTPSAWNRRARLRPARICVSDGGMNDAVLTVNAGSSSIKFALFAAGRDAPAALARGAIDGIGTAPRFAAHDGQGGVLEERSLGDAAQGHEALLGALLGFVETHLGRDRLIAVGHRVVHGGPQYGEPVLVGTGTLSALAALTPLAPLHQPHNLSPIRAIARARPDLPQVACFDTAFHRTMPAVARRI